MSHQSNRSRGERRQTATTLSFTKTRQSSSDRDSDSDTESPSKSLQKERPSSPTNDIESPPEKSTTKPAASAAPAAAWEPIPEDLIARHRVLTKVRYGAAN